MNQIQKKDFVANPDICEVLRSFGKGETTQEQRDDVLMFSAYQLLHNRLVEEVIKEAEKYNVVEELDWADINNVDFGNTFLMIPKLAQYVLISKDSVYSTNDIRTDGIIIALNLKDPTHIVDWSFGPKTDDSETPENCSAEKEIRIKFFTESTGATIYKLKGKSPLDT